VSDDPVDDGPPPKWASTTPLSPAETLRYFGVPGAMPSQVLTGPVTYDVRAHYEAVKKLHSAWHLNDEESCNEYTIDLLRSIEKGTRPASGNFFRSACGLIREVLETEGIYCPRLMALDYDASTSEWIRPYLIEQERFYESLPARLDAATDQLIEFFVLVFNHLAPEAAFIEVPENLNTTAAHSSS
jgi:hypothetical protein